MRQKEHGGTAPGKLKDTGGNVSTSEDAGKARDKAGQRVGVSGKSIDKIGIVKEYAPDRLADDSSLEQAYREAAKVRQASTQAKPGEGKVGSGNISGTVAHGDARDRIGERVGVSGKSIDKVAAKERQGARTDIVETFPPSEQGKARDRIGQRA